jgi:hypothetical protein
MMDANAVLGAGKLNLEAPKFPQHLSYSSLGTFATCPRKFFWGYICRLRKKSDWEVNTSSGKVFALAVQAVRDVYWGPNGGDADYALATGLHVLNKRWEDPPTEEGKKVKKTLPVFMKMLMEYFSQYPLESEPFTPVLTSTGKPMLEFSFELPLAVNNPDTAEPLLFKGVFDVLAHRGNTIWPFDDKTTGNVTAQWAKKWTLDSQMTGYIWAARTYYESVGGAIVRAIDIYCKTTTVLALRSDALIIQWMDATLRIIDYALQCYSKGEWPMHQFGTVCHQMFGTCPFHQLCSSEQPELWLADYEIKPEREDSDAAIVADSE